MTDWGASNRRDEFEFVLVDPFSLNETGESVPVEAGKGSITWGVWEADTDNLCSATIPLVRHTGKDRLIRVKHTITAGDGTKASETLGTFFVDHSEADATYGAVQRRASCYSTLIRFSGDDLAVDFSRTKGTNIVGEVRDLVEADGGRLRVMPGVDTSREHTMDIWFQVGTLRSTVLRTIANWTSCELGVDDEGFITWSPYVAPAQRALSYTFREGADDCVYVPGFHISDNREKRYNRVTAYYSRSSKPKHARKDEDGNYVKDAEGNTVYDYDDDYPVSASAYVDLPPTNPFSYERIGRRIGLTMSVEEPCSDDELRSQAQRRLDEVSGGVEYYEIEHAGIPGLRIGQRVRYINSRDATVPLDLDCIVEQIQMTLGPGCPCKTKLRAIGYGNLS